MGWIWVKWNVYQPRMVEMNSELETLNIKFKELDQMKNNLPQVREAFEATSQNFDTLKTRLTDNQSYVAMLEEIRSIAEKHNVEILSLSPSLSDSYPSIHTFLNHGNKHVERYPVQGRMQGEFFNICMMLDEITELPVDINIGKVKMESEMTEGKIVGCDVLFLTYMLVEGKGNSS